MENIILDGHKLSWHRERVKSWLDGERIAPITIDCALTRACNYKCVYCYGQLQENEGERMNKKTICNFLDDAAEIGVKAISFVSDGESTCSPYLYDAVKYGKKNKLDMALGTNGVLLKIEELEGMLGDLTYLRFNISAGQKQRYSQIHGTTPDNFDKVVKKIKKCVEIKKTSGFDVTLGLQMVLMPEFADQIIPLAELGGELGVDYLVIKHCSDDEFGSLGVDYSKYKELTNLLKDAEKISTEKYSIKVKWSKILSGGGRSYTQCFGPQFILQLSGSGLVAPCGMFFNERYNSFHIGNISQKRFKDIWRSERYWDVMGEISSERFNAKSMCGKLCLQHKVNEFLSDLKSGKRLLPEQPKETPIHVNFI
ncbi:MAG: radical SAM protein [Nanoarchaeota archaeon]